jgi:hypothetical protein
MWQKIFFLHSEIWGRIELTKQGLQFKQLNEARFSLQKILQNFSDSPSHRIFVHMHEALNIDKK